jgi:hypothetical protein
MVRLYPGSVFDAVIIIAVASVLLFGLLLILRKVCKNERFIKWFANTKIRHILLVITFVSFLVFVLTIVKLMVDVRQDISELITRLETCRRLSVTNSFLDRDNLKMDTERITVRDRKKIQEVINLIANADYMTPHLFFSGGMVDSANYLHIHAVEIGETGWYRIIAGYIVESMDLSESWRYGCTDTKLLENLRQALGLKGDYIYLAGDSEK